MRKFLVLFITAFLMLGCGNKNGDERGEEESMIAAKLFNQISETSLQNEIELMKELGVKQLFVLPKHFNTAEKVKILNESGIDLWLIAQIFYNDENENLKNPEPKWAICDDGETAQDKSRNGEWLKMVCPNDDEYSDYRIGALKDALSQVNFTGISLDFMRYFVFWEGVFPDTDPNILRNSCFCNVCISKFNDFTQITEIQGTNTVEIADYIKANHLDKWTEFKCKTIDEKVDKILADLRNDFPNLQANLHAVPWTKDDFNGAIKKIAGQDLSLLANRFAQISPMTYSKMLKHGGQWINNTISNIYNEIDGKNIIPAIQIQKIYDESFNKVTDFEDILRNTIKKPSSGAMIWQWEDLTEEQIEIIKKL